MLQIGTRDVHGETFGDAVADKKLLVEKQSITYDGEPFNNWGVNRDTNVEVHIYEDGVIHDIEVDECNYLGNYGGTIYKAYFGIGTFDNQGTINEVRTYGTFNNEGNIGNVCMKASADIFTNEGQIDTFTMLYGTLVNHELIKTLTITDGASSSIDNRGTICTAILDGAGYNFDNRGAINEVFMNLYYVNDTFTNEGLIDAFTLRGNGTLVNNEQINTLTMSGGVLDNAGGYIETLYYSGGTIECEGNIGEIIYVDNANVEADADWQDAAPLGEEVMVW